MHTIQNIIQSDLNPDYRRKMRRKMNILQFPKNKLNLSQADALSPSHSMFQDIDSNCNRPQILKVNVNKSGKFDSKSTKVNVLKEDCLFQSKGFCSPQLGSPKNPSPNDELKPTLSFHLPRQLKTILTLTDESPQLWSSLFSIKKPMQKSVRVPKDKKIEQLFKPKKTPKLSFLSTLFKKKKQVERENDILPSLNLSPEKSDPMQSLFSSSSGASTKKALSLLSFNKNTNTMSGSEESHIKNYIALDKQNKILKTQTQSSFVLRKPISSTHTLSTMQFQQAESTQDDENDNCWLTKHIRKQKLAKKLNSLINPDIQCNDKQHIEETQFTSKNIHQKLNQSIPKLKIIRKVKLQNEMNLIKGGNNRQ